MQAVALAAHRITAPFCASRQEFENLAKRLQISETLAMTQSELERLIESEGRNVLRQLMQDHLDLRAKNEEVRRVEDKDGVNRTQHRVHERAIETVLGTVELSRQGYMLRGVSSLHPLDAELNLPPERFSLQLRRRVAEEAAKNSFDESLQAIGATTGAKIAKRQLEQLVVRAAADFDAFYATREALTAKAVKEQSGLLVITTDGKGVVMRTADLREATKRAAQTQSHKLQSRLSKGEKKNRKRMAQVAAVYTIAPLHRSPEDIVRELAPVNEVPPVRPRPENKRVWASVAKNPEDVLREAFDEALRRDPKRSKVWVALCDGNETQLGLLEKFAREYSVKLTIVLDVIHVIEYLWKAVTMIHSESSPEAEQWVQTRLLSILHGKASDVAAGIRRSATLRELCADERKAADKCADYLLKYADYLRYNSYLQSGFPIATGVIEGACRHLIKDRLDITGARWGLRGAEAVLLLRSLRSSGDFDAYWTFHEAREHERNHATLYAKGTAPVLRKPTPKSPTPSRRRDRGHLRVVR